MRFGIYAEMQTPPGKSHSAMTWEILRQIEHADQVGFDAYSVIDHHFLSEVLNFRESSRTFCRSGSAHGANSISRGAVSRCRWKIRCGLAGQIAEADILTRGRLECGLGRGHAWLFGPSDNAAGRKPSAL